MLKIFLDIEPPTTTAQMKKVRVVKGRPMFYEPENVKEAKGILLRALEKQKPGQPIQGAIRMRAAWGYSIKGKHKPGEYRTTKPDTDNIEKLLKDCMTKTGYWVDDAQVVDERCIKFWAYGRPGILITLEEVDDSFPFVEEFAPVESSDE